MVMKINLNFSLILKIKFSFIFFLWNIKHSKLRWIEVWFSWSDFSLLWSAPYLQPSYQTTLFSSFYSTICGQTNTLVNFTGCLNCGHFLFINLPIKSFRVIVNGVVRCHLKIIAGQRFVFGMHPIRKIIYYQTHHQQ